MTGRTQRPILFLDVDGVLIPYGSDAAPDSAMISHADRDWVALDYRGHALLHRVDSHVGLTGADITVIERWLNDLPTVD